MARTLEESKNLFDKWAATYDGEISVTGGPLEGSQESLREIASLLHIPRGGELLDIGIGTGRFAALFEGMAGNIHGVDLSERMLQECGKLHPEFTLAPGSFTSLPYESNRFDTVISSFTFHENPPELRGAACAELARVLKPGGTACLLDIMFASRSACSEAERLLGRWWDPEEDYALVGDLDLMLRDAGFTRLFWLHTRPWHWGVIAVAGS